MLLSRFFGDGRQMKGGSTKNMTGRQLGHAAEKQRAFNEGKHNLVGNNKTGEDSFGRMKRF